jgi:asparagine synthase (glutamine-hydrolysing)
VGALLKDEEVMSIQAGTFHFDGAPANSDWLIKTSSDLSEYGPDGEYMYGNSSLGLLYRPLHTTEDSRCERQPLILEDGAILMWDGRLDNRDELIRSFRLDSNSRATDAVVVAAAFERYGTDCFQKLIGDWALSICSPKQHKIILARDYIGVKQLFYYLKGDALLWSSHLAALAQCGDSFKLCDEYIAGYLAFKPDAHLTPYQGIRSVPSGTFMIFRDSHAAQHRFWSFDPGRRTRYKTHVEYQEHYLFLLRQSVRRRLRADVPVLSSLSGGLDSSSIVCIADDLLAKGKTENRVDTVSYYDRSEPDEDDSYYLAFVERKRGRSGFHIELNRPEDCLSFEYAGFSAVPGFAMRAEVTRAMSDIIRRGRYRVFLNGTGGDEMNAQALSISVGIADAFMRIRPLRAWKDLLAWSHLTRRPLAHLLCEALLEFLPLSIRARCAGRGELQPWITPKFAAKYHLRARQLETLPGIWFWRPGPRDAAQTIMTLSNDLTFSSPAAVEERYPYLDQDLVEFLGSVPFDQLLLPGNRRLLMRRALTGIVPEQILERRTKVSAMRCYSLALAKHWKKVEEAFDHPVTSVLHYFDVHKLKQDLMAVRNGHCPFHLVRLLKALSLELWLRDVISRGIVTAPDGCAQSITAEDSKLAGKELVATNK